MVDLTGERGCDPAVPMPECRRVGKPDAGQVDGAAAAEIRGQRQQNSRNVSVGAIVDQHNHGVGVTVRGSTNHQHTDTPAAEHVVDDIAAVDRRSPAYHAALKSANATASSPVNEACQAAAAATARRSR